MSARKKSNKFGHFLAFIIFLVLSVSAGYVGATHFFGKENVDSPSSTKSDYPKDITKSSEFKDEVEQFSDWMQISDNMNQTKELSNRYEQLLEEQASLKSEVTKLHDSEYKARYAREKYMYTKDGEMILKNVEKDKEKNR